jgi:hypothetical protein
MGNTKFQNYAVLEPGTQVLVPMIIDGCIITKNQKGSTNVIYSLLLNEDDGCRSICRTIEEIIVDDLARYSDEKLKQELLKREALKSGGARGYDIT